jgi:pimeloyl-ACP methyl ester carboxylesterase
MRWSAALLVLLTAVALLAEPVRVRAVAATTMADALDLPVVRPAAPDVHRQPTSLAGVDGELYEVGADAPAVVLVPGAAPQGIDDPRIVRLAEAVARARRTVFVPELEVYEQDLVTEDVDRIARVVRELGRQRPGRVTLIGASFGGSLGLLAAADERTADHLALVATFGAYTDLLGLVQAATTGRSVVGGLELVWEDAHPDAEEIVREQVADLLDPSERGALEELLAGEADPEEIDGPAAAAFALLANDDPHRTEELAARLPTEIRSRIAQVSPATVAEEIEVPVVAIHAVGDPAIPYAELLRLGEAVPHARLVALEHFDHVTVDLDGPGEWLRAAGDLRRTWRFATEVLAAGEHADAAAP